MTIAEPDYSALLLSQIINAIPVALVMVNRKGYITLANEQAEKMFNYSRDQLIGEPIELLIPLRYRNKHPALRNHFLKAPITRAMGKGRDLYGLRKDGTEFPVEIRVSVVQSDSESYIVSAIVDISERKKLEKRFKLTVESAPTAMVMIDPSGTMVLVNKETERLFGYARDELLGKKVECLMPFRYAARHPELRIHYYSNISSRKMGEGRDLRGLRKNGSEFPVEIGLNPVVSDEGTFILAAIVDISDRKVSEKNLIQSKEALEKSNAELQLFAYAASHDLQTPLRSIVGFTQILSTKMAGKVDDETNKYLNYIIESTQRMQTLIQDLLSYARVDAVTPSFESVSLNKVFEKTLINLHSLITESKASITHTELPVVVGDESQLIQLMSNLLGNAMKYYKENTVPTIHVSAEFKAPFWTITINDQGIGIEAQYLKSIFEIFNRLHTHDKCPGTGLGLSICRRIVHRHHGNIWANSTPGKGCSFSFTLPGTYNSTGD